MKKAILRIVNSREFWSAIFVFGISLIISQIAINKARDHGTKPYFYQAYYEPAIRVACGQSFGVDQGGQLSVEMSDFLQLKRDSLTCDKVLPAVNLDPNPNLRAWYYLFVTTAAVWKLAGISWQALDILAVGILSTSALFIYAIFRLWMPAGVASLLAIVSILPARSYLLYMRDLGKAPFILASLLVVGFLVSQNLNRRMYYFLMAAIGAWLGIGYGFRPDVLIGIPLLIVTALFFRPVSLKRGLIDGLMGSVLMLITFLIAVSPILPAFQSKVGSCHWHFALLGLSDEHTGSLGLPATTYSLLTHYDDGMVAGTLVSYAERVLGISDLGFCSQAYDVASRSLYFELIHTFLGDFVSRAVAASKYVLGFGLGGNHRGAQASFFSISNLSLMLWATTVFLIFLKNIRLGIFTLFALAYLCAYPLIQFDKRHYFHLAFLGLLPVGLALTKLIENFCAFPKYGISNLLRGGVWQNKNRLLLSTAVIMGIGFFVMCVLLLSRQYQEVQGKKLFDKYLMASGEVVRLEPEVMRNESLRVVLPEQADELGKKTTVGRMLRIDIGGEACPASVKEVLVTLSGPNPTYEFKKSLYVDIAKNGEASIFLPVYFKSAEFSILNERYQSCIKRVLWLRTDELPNIWVTAVLNKNP